MFNLRLTGYGSSNQWQNLVLNGDKRKHKLWETKIIGYLKLKWIKEVFGVGEVNTDKNDLAFPELIQNLNERSLSLVMWDAKENAREAKNIQSTLC